MEAIAKDKIRDIEVNFAPHTLKLTISILFFNLVTLISVFYLVFHLNHWIVWIIDIVILVLVTTLSYTSFIKASKWRKYTLHENCLVMDTMFMHAEIDLSRLNKIKPMRTLFDVLFRRPATSLYIKLNDGTSYDVTYVNEDLDKLTDELWEISKTLKEKESI